MDFNSDFSSQFQASTDYSETDIGLTKKLQDTRNALQESQSETKTLIEIIDRLYKEARVEHKATDELLKEIQKEKTAPLFNNVALPRNADGLSVNERAGYAVYYLKFLGYATRRSTEEYHQTKGHLDSMHKSVVKNTLEIKVERSGAIKMPELDGVREMKRSAKAAAPPSPPATPPKQEKQAKTAKSS